MKTLRSVRAIANPENALIALMVTQIATNAVHRRMASAFKARPRAAIPVPASKDRLDA